MKLGDRLRRLRFDQSALALPRGALLRQRAAQHLMPRLK
jgi:hypothetical protein